MIIQCPKCKTKHQLQTNDIIKNKGKIIVFKCKKCANPIKIRINQKM